MSSGCQNCKALQEQLVAARADLRARDAFIREVRAGEIASENVIVQRDAALQRAEEEIARLKAFRFDIWFARGVSKVARRLARRR
jgi:hypothetical protein